MKKLSLLITAIDTGYSAQRRAVKIFFLAFILSCFTYTGFAQVTVTPAGGGTLICYTSAVGGSTPLCTTLGNIVITETVNTDFAVGGDVLTLHPPTGWQFCPILPTITRLAGGDITSTTPSFSAGDLQILITCPTITAADQITISGLKVQPLSPTTTGPGSICATVATGINGITTCAGPLPTDFGDLVMIPGTITGPSSICQFDSANYASLITTKALVTGPGIWTSSNPLFGKFDPFNFGELIALTPGIITTITYTIAGCSTTFGPITINKTPRAISGVRDMCAWFDNMWVYDIDSTPGGGTFNGGGAGGGGVTVSGALFTGHAFVQALNPGRDYITYHLKGTGCSVTDSFTVWPLPSVISGNDTICEGSTTTLSNLIAGTWSSLNPTIATVGAGTGIVFGVKGGTATIRYTSSSPRGCTRDTIVTVNPRPSLITGSLFACLGMSTVISDSVGGGTWTISNGNVSISPTTGSSTTVTGNFFGKDTITYTLPTGCFRDTVITVNPVPDTIAWTIKEECQGDSIIILTETSIGGAWSSSNPAIATIDPFTGAVYGVSPGLDTIFYKFPTGCSQMLVITIDTVPGPITGPDSMCVGDAFYLHCTPTSTKGCPWSYSPMGVGRSHIDCAGFITGGPLPGTLTVTYTLGTGCFTTRTQTVNPLPDTITGMHVICVGATLSLSDATSGGIWTSSATSVATVDSFTGVVTGVGFGVTVIHYILSTGCSVNFNVTVTPAPGTIIGSPTLCQGQTSTLSDLPPGGTWTSGSPAIVNVDYLLGVDTALSPGTAVITYSLGSVGCLQTFTVTVDTFAGITGPNTLCAGDIGIYYDTVFGVFPSGTWSSSNTSLLTFDPSHIDTGFTFNVNAGVDTIYYTTASGCVASMTVTIYPVANIIRHISDTLCSGITDTVTNAIPGGTWSSAITTIATITPIIPSIPSTAVIKAGASGTTSIYYILPSGCSSQILITVNPIPDTIVTPGAVCQGDTVTINDAGGGGVWSSVFTGIGTIDPASGLFGGISSGLDTVHYTNGFGCFVTDTVRVFPVAPITGPDSVCKGLTITLSDAVTGGIWTSSNTLVATIGSSTGVVTGVDSGSAIITYLTGNGCPVYDTVYVNPLPGKITGVDSACVSSWTQFFCLPGGGVWTSSNTAVATVDSFTGVIKGISGGSATITYTNTHGCITTASVLIHGLPSNISGGPDVCIGFTMLLTDGTPGGIWSSTNTAIATIDTTGLVTSVSVGTDTIIYFIPATGCEASIQIWVHGPPVVTITKAPPGMICRGGSDVLTASGASTYIWSPAYALVPTTGAVVTASPTITTTYTVIGSSTFHCADTVKVTVDVDTLLNHLKITGMDTICAGGHTTLTASGNDVSLFAWTPVTGLNCTICDTTVASPSETTKYEATAIDHFGCKDSVGILIIVIPPPIISVVSEPNYFPITLCRGTPLQLLAFGAYSYVWSPNLFLSCDSCANPIATDTFNMVYLVKGYTHFGCVDSMSVKISVLDTNFNQVSGDTAICIGGSAQLWAISHSVSSNLDIPSYLWTPATGLDNPTSYHPIATPDTTTTYTLVIRENACFFDTVKVKVSVEPYPVILLTPKSEHVSAGTAVQMTTTITNTPIQTYVWTPGNTVSCDTCANPKITPTAPTTTYTVTVTSIYGCTSYDTVTIFIGCNSDQVFIPNVFTPNGDGMNDRFYISGKGLKTITLFQIYNRWGQLVYQVENVNPNDPAAGWDGTFKGEVLEPDVFMYKVQAICELGGQTFKYQGDISLVR